MPKPSSASMVQIVRVAGSVEGGEIGSALRRAAALSSMFPRPLFAGAIVLLTSG